MNRLRILFATALLSSLLIVSMVPFHPISGEAQSEIQYPHLEQVKTYGDISTQVGDANFWVIDQDNDGEQELISCGSYSAFVLGYEAGEYFQEWFSTPLNCHRIAVGDLNGDSRQEIVVVTRVDTLFVFDGATYRKIAEVPVPDSNLGNQVTDLLVANVDGDAQKEIILTNESHTYILNGSNYSLKWKATDLGGTQVAAGNIDDDATVEIIVNGNTAHILNAGLKVEEWGFDGGFGAAFDIGDVDEDGKAEIACAFGYYLPAKIGLYDAVPFQAKWEKPAGVIEEIAIMDTDRDGIGEVVTGEAYWGDVEAYDASNGTLLWTIHNPLGGVSGLATGDLDNNLTNEIFWGSGLSDTSGDALIVGDWTTQSILWQSSDIDGPLYVATADIDLDDDQEIVVVSKDSNSNYSGGIIQVFDGATHILEWSQLIEDIFFDVNSLEIGQVDSDPALEIVVGGGYSYKTQIRVYDGQSRVLEWTSEQIDDGLPIRLLVANMDQDTIDEIVVAVNSGKVIAFDGRSGLIQWQRTGLSGVQDLASGDPNNDDIPELAILMVNSLQVFALSSGVQILNQSFENGEKIAITQASPGLASAYLIATTVPGLPYSYPARSYVQVHNGPDFSFIREVAITATDITSLQVSDLDGDGIDEYIVTGFSYSQDQFKFTAPSLIWIGSMATTGYLDYSAPLEPVGIYDIAAGDIDKDSLVELVTGTSTYWQIAELTYESRYILSAPYVGKETCVGQLFDDFSNPMSGWPVLDDSQATLSYIERTYQILVKNPESWVAVRYDQPFADMTTSVDVWNFHSFTGSYGLVFGLNEDWTQFYTFEILPTREFAVWHYNDAEGWEFVIGGYSEAISQIPYSSRINVSRVGTNFQIISNNSLLAVINDESIGGLRYWGFIVTSFDQGGLDVRYDNLSIQYNRCAIGETNQQQKFSFRNLLNQFQTGRNNR